jgi:hypothetical protein
MIRRYLQSNPNPDVGRDLSPEEQRQQDQRAAWTFGLIDDVLIAIVSSMFVGHGKPLNKIVGHAPTPGAVKTAIAVGSEFFPGHSYFPRFNLSERFLNLSKWVKKSSMTTMLGLSLFTGSMGQAWGAQDYGLNAVTESKLEALQYVAKKHGIDFKVTQGFRSQAQQDALYALGRTKPGNKVTWVRKSRHTTHTAFDIAVLKSGQVTWDPKSYTRIGQLGQSLGLTWGGSWKTKDLVHFELATASKFLSLDQYNKAKHLRSITNAVSKLSDWNINNQQNASNILFETATHESGRFRYTHQAGGPGLGYYSIVPETAEDLLRRAKKHVARVGPLPREMGLLTTNTGYTATQLSKMSREDLSKAITGNEVLSTAIARLRYITSPGKIPSTLEGRAEYASQWYYRGPDKATYKTQYIKDNLQMAAEMKSYEVKASQLSKVVQKHIPLGKPTQGLVNKVMHENKVKHAIASQAKKMVRHI